jgi:serine/threonine protein kinase
MSLEGHHLGEFEILDRLGQGGMGAVYKARQTSLRRTVALKTLQAALADDVEYIARFQQEAVAAAGLNHPNLVQVYSAGESEGLHWFAMEYVEGESAKVRLKRKGRLDPLEAIAIAIHVATALEYGWRKAALIHRDIKPDNIFLSSDGEVKLGDLGLAKSSGQTQGLTMTGASMGTPHYISPEQVEAMKDVDFRADIYSLGCTLFHLLSGQAPFDGNNAVAIMMKHVHAPVPDLRSAWPECPIELSTVVKRMMQKHPADRQQSYEEVNADLRRAYDVLSGATLPSVISVTQKPAPKGKKRGAPALAWGSVGVCLLAAIAVLVYFAPWKKRDAAFGSTNSALTYPDVAQSSARGADVPLSYPQPLKWRDGTASLRSRFLSSGDLVEEGEWLKSTSDKTYSLEPNETFRNPIVKVRFCDKVDICVRRGDPKRGDFRYIAEVRTNYASLSISDGRAVPLLIPSVPLDLTSAPHKEHEAVFAARGDTLTLWLDGRIVASVGDHRLASGTLAVSLSKGDSGSAGRIKNVEYGELPDLGVTGKILATATKDEPFVNTFGMKFVPVPGTQVLFSIWDTRVQDYKTYARDNKVDDSWTKQAKDGVPAGRELNHPVVGVSWEDAQRFCQWLTEKESAEGLLPKGLKYRLPTDEEWSWAVGLPPELGTTPEEKSGKNSVDFPWGRDYPPRQRVGNYADEAFHAKFPPKNNEKNRIDNQWIEGFTDGYATTSPVGDFPANAYGLHDMGGNVWQWCEDWVNASHKDRVLRGASWDHYARGTLLSAYRHHPPPGGRAFSSGFRCVVAPDAKSATAATGGVDSTAVAADLWQDVLAKIKLPEDVHDHSDGEPGNWELSGGSLRTNAGYGSVVITHVSVGPNYDLEFRLTRKAGGYVGSVGLPAGGRQVAWVSLGGSGCGFEQIGGKTIVKGETSASEAFVDRRDPFADQKAHHVFISVRTLPEGKVSLDSSIDGQASAAWTGSPDDLSLHSSWKHQPVGRLCFGGSIGPDTGEVGFSEVRFRPVTSYGGQLRSQLSTPAVPPVPLSSPPSASGPPAIKLWDSPEKITARGARWENGAMRLDGGSPTHDQPPHGDAVVRARIRMNPDAKDPQICLRHRIEDISHYQFYRLVISAAENAVKLESVVNGKSQALGRWSLPRVYSSEEWPLLELRDVGTELTATLDGQKLGTVRDNTITQPGGVMVFANQSGYFRDIVYVTLDKEPSAVAPTLKTQAPIAK